MTALTKELPNAHGRLYLTIQWTAAAIALVGAYLVGCSDPHHRLWGFILFLISNVLWVIWACHQSAWGLLAMQLAFCVTSLRGALANG